MLNKYNNNPLSYNIKYFRRNWLELDIFGMKWHCPMLYASHCIFSLLATMVFIMVVSEKLKYTLAKVSIEIL